MKKSTKEEMFYKRLRKLADISNTSINEEKPSLGTLVNFERGSDKVAYGIIKENHNYYLKKSNKQEEPNVADFAYIGGLENITKHQYKSLAEADKNRNMLLLTINEALGTKTDVISEEKVSKQTLNEGKETEDEKEEKKEKEVENKEKVEDAEEDAKEKEEKKDDKEEDDKEDKKEEDKKKAKKWNFEKKKDKVDESAEEELEKSAEIASTLDGAVEKEMAVAEPEIPVEPVDDAEADIDVDAVIDAPDDTPEVDAELNDAPDDTPEVDAELNDAPDDAPEVDGDPTAVGDSDEDNREIEKSVGKLTNKIRNTEMTPPQTQSYLNSLLTSFEDKLPELEIEERKEMANKLLKVVPDEEIEDIDVSVEDEMVEGKSCDECGFAKYVSERGYDADSIMECGIDEMANLMSGYIIDKDAEMGDEDYEDMSNFTNPDVEKSLAEEYGHTDISECMQPFTEKLNEDSANPEAKKAKIKGMFWWEIDPQKEKKTELVAETINGIDPASVDVQPNLNEEEEVDAVVAVEPEEEEEVLDLTKREQPELDMISGFESMGGGVVKPEGASTNAVDVNVDAENKTVNISMSEQKIRNYVRNRLEENAGRKKRSLNEDTKSEKLKKLDKMIDNQFKLYESEFVGEGGLGDFGQKLVKGFGKADQWLEGAFKMKKKIQERLPIIKSGQEANLLFDEVFKNKITAGIRKYAARTTPEEKIAILQQVINDPDGIGTVKADAGKFVYVPVNPTGKGSASGFATGRSRLGEDK